MVLALLPAVLAVLGVVLLFNQADKLDNWKAVQASVVNTHIDVRRGKSTRYAPVVTYDYRVGGVRYRSSTLAPMDLTGSRAWARGVVARYTRGTRVTAWHDPDQPARAYLLRQASFVPYALILIAIAGVGIFVVVRHVPHLDRVPEAPQGGWLAPEQPLLTRYAYGIAFGSLHLGLAAALAGHWFSITPGRSEWIVWVAFGASGAIAGLAIVMRARVLRLLACIGEARIRAHSTDAGLTARIEVPVRDHVEVDRVVVTLVRLRLNKDTKARRACLGLAKTDHVEPLNRLASAGETLALEVVVAIPEIETANASEWLETHIELTMRANGLPTYNQNYFVPEEFVRSAGAASGRDEATRTPLESHAGDENL